MSAFRGIDDFFEAVDQRRDDRPSPYENGRRSLQAIAQEAAEKQERLKAGPRISPGVKFAFTPRAGLYAWIAICLCNWRSDRVSTRGTARYLWDDHVEEAHG